jgi:hypothetical protein
MNYPRERNSNWKKDSTNYQTIHSWLQKNFEKKECEECGVTEKKLDWALLKGRKYLRKRENFKVLCRSCHLKYDCTKRRREIGKTLVLHRWKKNLTTGGDSCIINRV